MAQKLVNRRTIARSSRLVDKMDELEPILTEIDENFTEVYTAISAEGLDTDLVPVSRTNNPVVATDTANKNIDKLDAAIGADHSPLTRTVGQTAVANAVNTNIDALDTAIGADSQIAGNAKNISAANSVIQNLQSLDLYKSLRTVKVTIGAPGLAGTTYNFTSAANQTEQVITLTNILPAKARLVDMFICNDAPFTNAVSMAMDAGTTSGGGELITSGSVLNSGNIVASPNAGAFIATPSANATTLYVNATPGANWNTFSAGSVSVYITFIDVTGL